MSTKDFVKKQSVSRPYTIWANMKSRCQNKNNPAYLNYGGRGIDVCDKWQSFEGFMDDMYPTYKKGLTLDRINNKVGYTPNNCRWADRVIQNNNSRRNLNIAIDGVTKTFSQWAKYYGIKRSTASQRYHAYGWSIEKTFNLKKESRIILCQQ